MAIFLKRVLCDRKIFILLNTNLLLVLSAYARSYVMYLFGVSMNYVYKTIDLGSIFGKATPEILT